MEVVELYKIFFEKKPCESSERMGRLLGYIVSSVASIFLGGWVIGAMSLSSDRRPELEYVGLLFMVLMWIIMMREHRGGSEPTWISTAFIWLVRFCLGGADASNR
jgi:hypothetical protein